MKLLGFNFLKINAEKSEKGYSGKINIKSDMDIKDIIETNSEIVSSKDKLMAIKFNYSINYQPDFAKISFQGVLIVSSPIEESKEILSEWENKQIPEKFRITLLNMILKKSNLKALQLEEELNLPSHIPMPSLKSSNKN